MKKEGISRAGKAFWLASVAGISLAVAGFGGAAYAQETDVADDEAVNVSDTDGSEATDEGRMLDRVVTTGSRIRGVDPVGSNVISVGQADLENTSALTTQDLLNQIPQVSREGFNEGTFQNVSGGLNVTRGSAINLRGVGSRATLPLLDGHRMAFNGTTGGQIDPSVIPTLAIGRIEVVADGASALYGADAVAGVFNMALRRDLDGFEANARYGAADSLDQWSVGFAGGSLWETGQLMIAFEHTYRSELAGMDRDWYTADNTGNGGTDLRLTQCNPGNIIIDGVTYPVPAGGATPENLVPGTPNRCDDTRLGDILPSQERDVVTATFQQELTDWLEFSGSAVYLEREVDGKFVFQGPARLFETLTIPSTNPYFVLPDGVTATSETVEYSFGPEYGGIPYVASEQTVHLVGGFNVSLGHDWKAWIGGVYGHNDSFQSNLWINPGALAAAVNSPNPSTALNPFGPNDPAILDSIFSFVFAPEGENDLTVLELKADGPLFEVPAGTVRIAIGAEHAESEVIGGTTQGPVANASRTPVAVSREVDSVFGEVYVPLADNDAFGSLELSAALRYDNYSDFGSTTNPKIGLTYEPMPSLQFKASYGTSFRAPLLTNTVTARGGARLTGGFRPDAQGNQIPIAMLAAGNPNLEPETATTYSFGVTFEPESLPGFRANLNYYNLDYEDQILSVQNDQTLLSQLDVYEGVVVTDFGRPYSPAEVMAIPEVAAAMAEGVQNRGLAFPTLYLIDARPFNLGRTKTDGVDFDFSYTTHMAGGDLTSRIAGAYVLSYDVQQVAGAPVIDRLNTYQNPLQFKFRATTLWQGDAYDLGAYVNYSNSYDIPTSPNNTSVDSFTTLDLHGALHLSELFDNASLGDTTLALDIQNVFDEDPPFIDILGAYDPNEGSPIGRLVTVTVRTRF